MVGRQHFDRNMAIETGLIGLIYGGHSASPNGFKDVIPAEVLANEVVHGLLTFWSCGFSDI
jgi:hypothetical protein